MVEDFARFFCVFPRTPPRLTDEEELDDMDHDDEQRGEHEFIANRDDEVEDSVEGERRRSGKPRALVV